MRVCNRIIGFSSALLLCCLILPRAAAAETDFRMWGDIDISLSRLENADFTTDNQADGFSPRQRVRLWLEARTSESLSAFAMFRIATARWGEKNAGYSLDTDGVNVRMRFLFLDWHPENSDFAWRVGFIPLAVPNSAFFTGILNSSGGGIEGTYKFNDVVGLKGVWARPYDDYGNDYLEGGAEHLDDEMDLFQVMLPITVAEPALNVTPWAMYSRIGKDSGYWATRVPAIGSLPAGVSKTTDDSANAWWAGISASSTWLDPITIKFDFDYGSLKTDTDGQNFNTKGWQTALAVDYSASWGTPGLFGWYATGSDADKVENDRTWGYIPVVSAFDIGFNPTSFGFGDYYGVNLGSQVSWHAGGRWGVGVQVKDISFWRDLTHTVRVAYYEGTNDKELAANPGPNRSGYADLALMTKGDSAVEVNFNHQLKVYENLIVAADLGYINMDRCEEWGAGQDVSDAWQAAVNFRIKF